MEFVLSALNTGGLVLSKQTSMFDYSFESSWRHDSNEWYNIDIGCEMMILDCFVISLPGAPIQRSVMWEFLHKVV